VCVQALVLDDRCPDYDAQDAPDWMRDAPVYTKSARLQAPLGTLPLLGPWTLVTWVRVDRPGCLWVFRNESVCIDSAVRIARGNITYESLAILGTQRWYHVAIRMLPRPRLFVDATPVPLYVTPTSARVRMGDMSVWNLVVLDDTANFEVSESIWRERTYAHKNTGSMCRMEVTPAFFHDCHENCDAPPLSSYGQIFRRFL